jgi:hypothetical protein
MNPDAMATNRKRLPPGPGLWTTGTAPSSAAVGEESEFAQAVRRSSEAANVPVALYGLKNENGVRNA